MTDMELAEEIEEAAEHGDRGYARVWFTANGDLQIRCRNLEEIQAIIAALRRGPERPPSGEMGYEEYHDGIIGVFKTNADGSRNLLVLTPQASEQFRAMFSAAEASKEAK